MADPPGGPPGPRLSVVIPVYNERPTIEAILQRVAATGLAGQILVVDDGSTDASAEVAERFAAEHPEVGVLRHERNRGKGAAVRTGIAHARGQFTIVQDADLEYDPNDIARLLAVAEERGARVVYGSRILGSKARSYHRYYWGGRLVSLVASLLYGQRITDEPTCYKLFRTDLLRSLPLREEGFGFCAEATALVCRRGERIVEVPISYHPRSIGEGKKIRWTDGLRAVWLLVKHRFRPASRSGAARTKEHRPEPAERRGIPEPSHGSRRQ
jgi:glycosyltransferase involved in cell wall biosynthesis